MVSVVPDLLSLHLQRRTHIAGKEAVCPFVPPFTQFTWQFVNSLYDMPLHARTVEAEAVVIADASRAFAFGSTAIYHQITQVHLYRDTRSGVLHCLKLAWTENITLSKEQTAQQNIFREITGIVKELWMQYVIAQNRWQRYWYILKPKTER